MAYTTGTLTGTYKTWDGDSDSGYVEIIPNSRTLVDAEGSVVLSGRVRADLDVNGSFSVVLPATDDATVEPATGRQYAVVARLDQTHHKAIRGIELPAGSTVDVATVAAQPEVAASVSNAATTAQLAAIEAALTTELATKADTVTVDAALAGKQDAGDYATTTALTTGLAGKADTASLAPVATTGAYGDLTGQPTIPTTPGEVGAEPVGLSAATLADLSASYARVFTPEAYGAVGDGVADDTTAVQAALDAAAAPGGGRLIFAAKTYRVTAPLTVTNTSGGITSGPDVRGSGQHRTTILCDFDTGAAFDITGCQVSPASLDVFMRGGGIRDLSIEQVTGRTGVVGIKAIGWWYADIADLDIEVSSHAIHIPLRTDISSNPDYYACAEWHIHHNDLSLNGGKGVYGEAGLGFPYAKIEQNRITNNLSDGVWVAGHGARVTQNAIVSNGQYDGATQGAASGVVVGFVTGQAIPNGVVIEDNEIQGNVTDNIRFVACSGFSASRNRLISDVATVSSVTALYPPLHVALGVSTTVQAVVNGEMKGNYHRSGTTGSHALSLYKPGHTSASDLRIENNRVQAADNTSAMVKYDGFNTNHRVEIIENGRLAAMGLSTLWYLGRIRTAANVTGTMAQVVFDNEWVDPSGSNDPTLGYLTPFLGPYRVDFAVTIGGLTAGNTVTIQIAGNGSVVKEFAFGAQGLTNETFAGSALVYVVAGTRFTLRASQNSGADKAIQVSDTRNSFSVQAVR